MTSNSISEREWFSRHFSHDIHVQFILNIQDAKDRFEYCVTEHLRLSGVYWGVSAMALLNELDRMNIDEIVTFVKSCKNDSDGGYGGNSNHDSHLLYTTSAIQICALLDRMDILDTESIISWIVSLQQPNGSFIGDKWGECDTRFTYCALNSLSLLKALDRIDIPRAIQFIKSCRNFDGGFGCVSGAESHSGQIFCCIGSLAIMGALDDDEVVEKDVLGWWLAERQLPCGGLNGRPEKKEDVCYSWWVLSALSILKRLEWIDRDQLAEFILKCQDNKQGGISDRPDNMTDIFHTFFGIAGLSLLGYPHLEPIDPVYALPCSVLKRLGIQSDYQC